MLKTGVARKLLGAAFRVLRPRRLYEPVEFGGRRYAGKREADARWQAISDIVRAYGARSILDVGCAEGWFLRRAATEFGCFGIGVEANLRRLMLGEFARLHDGAERVAVMQGFLTPVNIPGLPICDLVLCLSVAHHVLRRDGIAATEDFLRALLRRTGKAMIFEMGTSDEKALSWTHALPSMPEGQEAFVRGLLAKAGAVNIRVVADTPGLKADAQRLLFVAEPKRVAGGVV